MSSEKQNADLRERAKEEVYGNYRNDARQLGREGVDNNNIKGKNDEGKHTCKKTGGQNEALHGGAKRNSSSGECGCGGSES